LPWQQRVPRLDATFSTAENADLDHCRSMIWQSESPPSSPRYCRSRSAVDASIAAPSRFSISSVFAPVDITGIGWPIAIADLSNRNSCRSPRRRTTGVQRLTENAPDNGCIIADKAHALDTSSTNGSRSRLQAVLKLPAHPPGWPIGY